MLRRMFSAALVLTLAAAVLAAVPVCAQESDSTITIGVTDLPNTLDPGEAFDFAAWEVLGHLYTGLTRQVPGTLEYELALADAVQVSDDHLTYTFTLHQDAAFSDGTPITAQTFVDSIQRVLRLQRSAEDAIRPYVEAVAATENGDLVFQLKRPVPYFLGLVSLPPYFPMHPTLAQAENIVPYPEELIGNGPYLLDSYEVNGQITLRANPTYTYGPPPATETIVLRYFRRSQELRDALRAHEIDMAWRALLLNDLLQLENLDGLAVTHTASMRVFYLYMNHDLEPFDDPLAREAITLLIDRRSIVENVFDGYAVPLNSLVPAQFPDAYAAIWPNTRDQEAAEEVLRAGAYGLRGQQRLQFTIYISRPTFGDLYVLAANDLIRHSFTGTEYIASSVFYDIDTSTYIRALERGEGRLVLFAWTPLVPHPAAYLYPLAHSEANIPANGKYARPAIDVLLDQAAPLDDPVEQGALYQQAAAELLSTHDIIPLWQDDLQVVAWDDIEGILIEPNFFLHYDRLARE